LKSLLCPFGNIHPLGVVALIAIAVAASEHSLSAQNPDLQPDLQTALNQTSPHLAVPVVDSSFRSQAAPALPLSFQAALFIQNSSEASDSAASDSASAITASLPDEPTPMENLSDSSSSSAADTDSHPYTRPDPASAKRVAPIYHRYIEPGEIAQKLTPGQQLVFGLAQTVSPYFLVQIAAAAGYEQAVNGAPNYGSNIRAYGQRVGAAAARNASQSFFSYSVMAPLLHEDARYYIMGNRRNAFIRATYAASRAFVTRDANDGHAIPNYAEISGYAEAAGLTNAYYPSVNRTFGRTASSFGVSLGGLALSNVVREFLPDILRVAHLEKFE